MTSATSRHDVATATAATAEQGADSAQAIEYIEGKPPNVLWAFGSELFKRIALFSIARVLVRREQQLDANFLFILPTPRSDISRLVQQSTYFPYTFSLHQEEGCLLSTLQIRLQNTAQTDAKDRPCRSAQAPAHILQHQGYPSLQPFLPRFRAVAYRTSIPLCGDAARGIGRSGEQGSWSGDLDVDGRLER